MCKPGSGSLPCLRVCLEVRTELNSEREAQRWTLLLCSQRGRVVEAQYPPTYLGLQAYPNGIINIPRAGESAVPISLTSLKTMTRAYCATCVPSKTRSSPPQNSRPAHACCLTYFGICRQIDDVSRHDSHPAAIQPLRQPQRRAGRKQRDTATALVQGPVVLYGGVMSR